VEQVSHQRYIRTAADCPTRGTYLVEPDGRREPAGNGRAPHAAVPEATCRYCGEVTPASALTELYQDFFVHPKCVEDWRDAKGGTHGRRHLTN
jgi:hypothetical protein